MSYLRIAGSLVLAVLPSRLKVRLYRVLCRYQIGKGVKIGFGTAFVGVKRCRIGDHVRIGYMNLFCQLGELDIADHAHIGSMNLFRGGSKIIVGAYAAILRCNVFNSIRQPDTVNRSQAILELGTGVVVTTAHWLDFTDRITVGSHAIIGGRHSSLWTHNRQRTRPITVGPHCYLGSGTMIAPGVEVPSSCIVALGSVLRGQFTAPRSLIAGNPAAILRPLQKQDLFLVTQKTRNDIPDKVHMPVPTRIQMDLGDSGNVRVGKEE